jgi:hypothetical protein
MDGYTMAAAFSGYRFYRWFAFPNALAAGVG